MPAIWDNWDGLQVFISPFLGVERSSPQHEMIDDWEIRFVFDCKL